MQAKDYVKHIALWSCVYYTVTTFVILFLYLILNKDLSGGLQAVALICVLPFSICFAGANTLYRHSELQKWLRVLLHYALTVGGAFICLYLPNKDPQQSSSTALVLFIVFTVLYALVMGTVLVVYARIHRVQRDEAKYESVYKK